MISLLSGQGFDPLSLFLLVLAGAAFVVEAWALIDGVTRPTGAFASAGKQTKKLWLLILTPAAFVGGGGFLIAPGLYLSALSMLLIAAFVASSVYMVDVRPKVREIRKGGGGSSYGPYGPW